MLFEDALEIVLDLAKQNVERTEDTDEAINIVEDFIVNELGED